MGLKENFYCKVVSHQNRKFQMRVGSTLSRERGIHNGVLQGSVLAPYYKITKTQTNVGRMHENDVKCPILHLGRNNPEF